MKKTDKDKLRDEIIELCNYYYGIKGTIGTYGKWYYDVEMGFTCDTAHWTYCLRKMRERFGGYKLVNLDNAPLDLAHKITTYFMLEV